MYIFIKELKYDEELIKNISLPKILKKAIIKLKKIFNIVTAKQIDKKHILYIIPKVEDAKKIEKIIKKNANAKIILSKSLKKYEKELNLKRENKIIRYFIYDILKYIMDKMNTKIQLQNLYILVNEYNSNNIEVIRYLTDKVKTVNIVTNNINKFNKLEENMYNEEGILIAVTNNKNKSLKRANFIINLDFDRETISKYKINRNAIIINCTNEKIDILKYFQGVIVNNIEIKLEENNELYEEFDQIDVYESFKSESIKYIENVRKIENDKVKIINLIGNNGEINTKELANLQKNIDKL